MDQAVLRTFEVTAPEPIDARPPVALGRLGPALVWLASTQGSWPPRPPGTVRRVLLDGAALDGGHLDGPDPGGPDPGGPDPGGPDPGGPDPGGDVEAGAVLADQIADAGVELVVVGADVDQAPGVLLLATLLELEPVHAVGTASGADWASLLVAVRDGLRTSRPLSHDPAALLAALASPALSQLTGLLAQCAVRRTAVVLDGSAVVCAAALAAGRLAPGAAAWWLAGQTPPGPAAVKALAELRLSGLLDLRLALPEGGELALSVLEQAVAVLQRQP